jgi:hypothetical protein
MFDLGDQLAGLDLTGAALLPGWMLALVTAAAVLVCTIGAMRYGFEISNASVVSFAVVFIAALAVAWLLDHWAARDLAAERRAVDARAFELRLRAVTPGSALACLDATAGEMIQDACEKALFASPEATAGAVSYVRAQLALLATGRKHALASGLSYSKVLPTLRGAIEIDRFGIVAYLFAMRPGCGPKQCDLFVLLQDTSRVRANLANRTFESYVKTHMADWPSAGSRSLASNPPPDSGPPAAPVPPAAAKPPSNLFFPSASSIPSVNIMTAEPAAGQQPHETTASADAAARTRRQAPGAPQARQAPGADSGQVRSAPLQIAPPAQ